MSASATPAVQAVPLTRRLPRLPRSATDFLWGILLPILVFAVWEALSDNHAINPILFSSPSAIARYGWTQITAGTLFVNLAASLGELLVGFIIASVLGIVIGVAMGSWRRADYALEPIIIGLYSAPIVALYPLLIIWFGLGYTAILVLVILFSLFPVVVNTSLGVRLIDPILLRTARSFGASRSETLWKVVLPAALPSIVTGLRLALGRALIGVVVAELFMGSAGLGYAIGTAASQLQTGEVFWGILVLGVLGVTLTGLVGMIERRVQRGQMQ